MQKAKDERRRKEEVRLAGFVNSKSMNNARDRISFSRQNLPVDRR